MHRLPSLPCLIALVLLLVPSTLAGAEGPPSPFAGLRIDGAAPPKMDCVESAETLCLLEGRLMLEGRWKNQHDGGTEGVARALPLTDKTGMFWFFQEDNIEVILKALDATVVNGHFWIFLGSLSDVEYWIDATNTTTGERVTYYNPPGNLYGIADITALDSGVGQHCGTIVGIQCPGDLFCDPRSPEPEHNLCQVTDVGGECVAVPEVCPAIFEPVCGCDGVTYASDCHRLQARVPKEKDGEC